MCWKITESFVQHLYRDFFYFTSPLPPFLSIRPGSCEHANLYQSESETGKRVHRFYILFRTFILLPADGYSFSLRRPLPQQLLRLPLLLALGSFRMGLRATCRLRDELGIIQGSRLCDCFSRLCCVDCCCFSWRYFSSFRRFSCH